MSVLFRLWLLLLVPEALLLHIITQPVLVEPVVLVRTVQQLAEVVQIPIPIIAEAWAASDLAVILI
jgi:hypothetical protein